MKYLLPLYLFVFSFFGFSFSSFACSPCGALSNVTQNLVGTNLELTFTSNAGWQCCYTVEIEIVCSNADFTGIPNYFSQEICINGGSCATCTDNTPVPYPLTILDLSNLCAGEYKWRASETGCGIYTPEYTFTISGGSSPITLTSNLSTDTICTGESAQFTSSATGGCTAAPSYAYSWSPATGLSNANIANPIATPGATTTYTLTVTENGACTLPQTASYTVTVNPSPTATITGTTDVCLNDVSPQLTLTGQGATAPYTINYSINGVPQTALVTTGNSVTVNVPTGTAGTYTYELIDVTESSSAECSQTQSGTATVVVNPLPTVDAGEDIVQCEPGGGTPSDVTLTGSGASTYTWDNDVVNGTAFTPPTGTTIYTVSGTDVNGCVNTDQVSVTALNLPVAIGTPSDTLGNAPMTIDFSNSSLYASTYLWDYQDGNTDNTTSTNVIVSNTFTVPGYYEVVLTASNGICVDTDTILVHVLPPMIVTPPNVFTPNGDGVNEEYFVNVQFGEFFEAEIINRWGNYITSLSSLNQGWDGKLNGQPVDDGVYYIKFIATDYNGQQVDGHTYFHLIRN
ncbi:MAG: T9SS type B sorting domain-containing protein [Cryomorphaceae bacterium]|jgi:gliding motility-associated-like protein|nr:T9SS type B sorting domain-containing protein [Cryomorphaceae bacterium]